jgi:DNA-binding HxlR family transcriptional regulator
MESRIGQPVRDMTKAYDQCCPIAMALDVVGERWSLLIVRELLLGPLRFGELSAGLPGIGSKQLTERLRSLTDQKVITAVGTAGSTRPMAYALTARGQALAPTLRALATFGSELLEAGQPSNPASPTSIALMMWARASAYDDALLGTVLVKVAGQSFLFDFSGKGVVAARVSSGTPSDARIELDGVYAWALLSHSNRRAGAPRPEASGVGTAGLHPERYLAALIRPPSEVDRAHPGAEHAGRD